MILTTQKIIEMLPFDNEFKTQLLGDWDKLTVDQRFNIERLVWDAFGDIYNTRLKANLDLAMLKVAKKEDTFDPDFYKRVKQKTEQELEEQLADETTTTDLSSTREELEKLIKQSN